MGRGMARLIDLKNLTLSPEKQKSNTVLGTSPESGILLMFGAVGCGTRRDKLEFRRAPDSGYHERRGGCGAQGRLVMLSVSGRNTRIASGPAKFVTLFETHRPQLVKNRTRF